MLDSVTANNCWSSLRTDPDIVAIRSSMSLSGRDASGERERSPPNHVDAFFASECFGQCSSVERQGSIGAASVAPSPPMGGFINHNDDESPNDARNASKTFCGLYRARVEEELSRSPLPIPPSLHVPISSRRQQELRTVTQRNYNPDRKVTLSVASSSPGVSSTGTGTDKAYVNNIHSDALHYYNHKDHDVDQGSLCSSHHDCKMKEETGECLQTPDLTHTCRSKLNNADDPKNNHLSMSRESRDIGSPKARSLDYGETRNFGSHVETRSALCTSYNQECLFSPETTKRCKPSHCSSQEIRVYNRGEKYSSGCRDNGNYADAANGTVGNDSECVLHGDHKIFDDTDHLRNHTLSSHACFMYRRFNEKKTLGSAYTDAPLCESQGLTVAHPTGLSITSLRHTQRENGNPISADCFSWSWSVSKSANVSVSPGGKSCVSDASDAVRHILSKYGSLSVDSNKNISTADKNGYSHYRSISIPMYAMGSVGWQDGTVSFTVAVGFEGKFSDTARPQRKDDYVPLSGIVDQLGEVRSNDPIAIKARVGVGIAEDLFQPATNAGSILFWSDGYVSYQQHKCKVVRQRCGHSWRIPCQVSVHFQPDRKRIFVVVDGVLLKPQLTVHNMTGFLTPLVVFGEEGLQASIIR